jgi:hypothetical protein
MMVIWIRVSVSGGFDRTRVGREWNWRERLAMRTCRAPGLQPYMYTKLNVPDLLSGKEGGRCQGLCCVESA